MTTPSARLQQAAELIKAGNRAAAYAILREIIPQMPNDWRAWWSLAHASTNPNERIQALKRVLQLKPDHPKAAEALSKLQAAQSASAPPTSPPQPSQPSPDAIQPLSSVRQPAAPPAQQTPWGSDDPFPEAAVPSAVSGAEPWAGAPAPWESAAQPWNVSTGGTSATETEPWEQDNPFDAAASRSGSFDPWGGEGARAVSVAPPAFVVPAGSGSVGRPLTPATSGTPPAAETKKFVMIMVGTAVVLLVLACGLFVVSALRGGFNLLGGGAPNNFTGGDPYRTVGGGTLTINGDPVTATLNGLNDAHNWAFEGRAGQTVEITAQTLDQCDPRIRLLNPTGGMLAMDDDGGGYPNSYLQYTLPVDGVYTVRVDVFRGGSYRLAVRTL